MGDGVGGGSVPANAVAVVNVVYVLSALRARALAMTNLESAFPTPTYPAHEYPRRLDRLADGIESGFIPQGLEVRRFV